MPTSLETSFDRYVQKQQHLFEQLQDEQAKALRMGLITDPKSEQHGGYRIACVWPDAVTQPACDLSARLAELLPGTPAYRYDSIHSSIGNIAAPGGRLVDPHGVPEDRELLDRLSGAVEMALHAHDQEVEHPSQVISFGPALLAPRMALVYGRPAAAYWALQRAIEGACAANGIELFGSWGPHLTLTRFGRAADPEQVPPVAEALATWQPVTATPVSVLVGYYTVAPDGFCVDAYATFELK
jgi:hypothetical protein